MSRAQYSTQYSWWPLLVGGSGSFLNSLLLVYAGGSDSLLLVYAGISDFSLLWCAEEYGGGGDIDEIF